MTETKWTPGPHFAEIIYSQIPESEDGDITYRVIDKDKKEIVTFYTESDEALANAQLYAAAPDLYDALKETLEISARYESGDYIERANAAIRKARGE